MNFGHEYLPVAIAKHRKARRRIAKVDCISELNLDSGKAEVGSQSFRPQERRSPLYTVFSWLIRVKIAGPSGRAV